MRHGEVAGAGAGGKLGAAEIRSPVIPGVITESGPAGCCGLEVVAPIPDVTRGHPGSSRGC